jgi:hypothetical protein
MSLTDTLLKSREKRFTLPYHAKNMRHLKHARSQLFSWENGSREHIMVSEALECALQVLQKVTLSPTQKNANRFFKNSGKIMLTNFSIF